MYLTRKLISLFGLKRAFRHQNHTHTKTAPNHVYRVNHDKPLCIHRLHIFIYPFIQRPTGSAIWTTKADKKRVKQGGYVRANKKFRLDEMCPPQFVKHCIAGAAGCLWQAQIRACGVLCLSVIEAGYTTV